MRRRLNKIFLAVFFLLLAALFVALPSRAEDSQENLNQYVADLQNNPYDSALREKIIKLVQNMNVKPAVPKEVIKIEGAAEYAFSNAKSESDYLDAAKEYEKALLLAPWLAQGYYNCAVAYKSAGKLQEAIDAFNFYLMAAPDASDAQEVQKEIGGLEYALGKSEEEAEVVRQVSDVIEIFRTLSGGGDYERWIAASVNPWNWPSGKAIPGVNGEEFKGKNWYQFGEGILYKLVFKKDRILVCFVTDLGAVKQDEPDLIGIPKGPTISDIQWGRPATTEEDIAEYGADGIKPVWAKVNENTWEIFWSWDRPAEDKYYNPNARYNYTWCRKPR
ncbi:MAG: tetratricopeptide repeat protein [Candidatus Omnitrophota bacterium]